MTIVQPTGKMSARQLRHKLNVAHASGRLQPNGRARAAKGKWRGDRSATRRRAISEQVR
ncbi:MULTISPECIES: hypothetical protein [unclassified Rhodococcus (in: high G+C Gram-positive bacteria)]|nr:MULTISPECIES: hypothetical protein [unclassified Rhodococcus (in: high G+C Gram-positive bacteria)]WSE25751.1 hypothetical protein U9J23_27420 [Rhodococcus sp. PD04]BDB63416.1 hypothetical protein RDE2_52100 [Rhodococcus sp. RDE2]